MKPEWKDFLINRGAELSDGRVTHYGNPQQELAVSLSGKVLADLSHFGLIEVHGEDAANFLQNQLTSDANEVTDSHSQLSAWCNPKGRILANFRIFIRENTWYLRLPQAMIEQLMEKLRMYILRSKVTMEDASLGLTRIGYSGPGADTELNEIIGAIPAAVDQIMTVNELTVIRVPGITPSFEIYGELEPIKKLWTRLDVHAAPVGALSWTLLEILAGIPTITPQTSGLFVPQMINYQAIGGVSFTKGCYPGQEIVARMHYLGNLKRRMWIAHIDIDKPPLPGTEVCVRSDRESRKTGEVVDAAAHPDGGCEVLAVIQINDATNEIRLAGINGPVLNLREPPYDIPRGHKDKSPA